MRGLNFEEKVKMAKIQRKDRRIADMLRKGRSIDYIAKDLMISPSEVDSSIKRLKKAEIPIEKVKK